jgi:hypothetical protein
MQNEKQDENDRPQYEPGKSPIIQGLIPGLTERGKIKIGMKGAERTSSGGSTFQLPQKLNHFIVTTLERGKDGNFLRDISLYAALKLDAEPKKLPILLLFDDIALNFQCRYTCYMGKTMFCSGDGVAAFQMKSKTEPQRAQVTCPCYRKESTFKGDDDRGNGRCKINGTLSCMLAGANVIGGVWKFRTTGYNSTVGILSSLTLIKTMTGGLLAGIPLVLTIQPKVATNPVDGRAVTIYVVGVEYAGTMDDLQHGALQLAQKNAGFRKRLTHVEDEVRNLISVDAEVVDQAGDVTKEFYPQEPPNATLVKPEIAGTTTQIEPKQPQRRRGRGPGKKNAVAEPAGAEAPAETPAASETIAPSATVPAQEPPTAALAVPDGALNCDLFD